MRRALTVTSSKPSAKICGPGHSILPIGALCPSHLTSTSKFLWARRQWPGPPPILMPVEFFPRPFTHGSWLKRATLKCLAPSQSFSSPSHYHAMIRSRVQFEVPPPGGIEVQPSQKTTCAEESTKGLYLGRSKVGAHDRLVRHRATKRKSWLKGDPS